LERESRQRQAAAIRREAYMAALEEQELLATLHGADLEEFEAVRVARRKGTTYQIQLARVKVTVEKMNKKYAAALEDLGVTVQVVPARRGEIDRFLWAAASADSESEAAVMLSRARSLVGEEGPGLAEAVMSPADTLQRSLGPVTARDVRLREQALKEQRNLRLWA
jgi:hypothetical protein